ncbi:hypothetical protein P7K49_002034 [Saguinus oedipus]|uniref:Thioredoxin domain-containing protein n=1 Tax=Saguinus oedipus TaxID=9490 RepID=A0ABQ9WG92_SAGOE|nr:hypothetical protein P7K49_002034 [Saguinus oedipus]
MGGAGLDAWGQGEGRSRRAGAGRDGTGRAGAGRGAPAQATVVARVKVQRAGGTSNMAAFGAAMARCPRVGAGPAPGVRRSSSPRAAGLPRLLVLLAAATAGPGTGGAARLYRAGEDAVWVLDSGSVRGATANSSAAWLVQFYSSWCGHCVGYAPTWRALAGDVRGEARPRAGTPDPWDRGFRGPPATAPEGGSLGLSQARFFLTEEPASQAPHSDHPWPLQRQGTKPAAPHVSSKCTAFEKSFAKLLVAFCTFFLSAFMWWPIVNQSRSCSHALQVRVGVGAGSHSTFPLQWVLGPFDSNGLLLFDLMFSYVPVDLTQNRGQRLE